ncbi:hypothetical protein AYI69_g4904 [Smittium culicis]|uniref:Uncharacterized protein n=1 Tax=Smittium culicis TaxID=133412 RepID=A0A1R1Y9R1_9FUNG|nr:hypothetical protein AYI69_g4904 [Smittium culicis]
MEKMGEIEKDIETSSKVQTLDSSTSVAAFVDIRGNDQWNDDIDSDGEYRVLAYEHGVAADIWQIVGCAWANNFAEVLYFCAYSIVGRRWVWEQHEFANNHACAYGSWSRCIGAGTFLDNSTKAGRVDEK